MLASDATPCVETPTLRRIAVLNSKGGSGKTTLATNLAAMLSSMGQSTAILDYDKQASSMFWLKKRQMNNLDIAGVEAFRPTPVNTTRSWFLRVPEGTQWVILDTPAAIDDHQLRQFITQAHLVLIPVMPSPSDIHAVTRFIERLFVAGRVKTIPTRVGIIANRVKLNIDVYRNLRRFLDTMKLPVVAQLRDSHHYVQAAMDGLSVGELAHGRDACDASEWAKLYAWISATPNATEDPSALPLRRPEKKDSETSDTIVAA